MGDLERRTLLAVGASAMAGLAGCGGPKTMYAGSERVTVDPGDYAVFEFSLPSPATMRYTVDVVEGGPIDVVVATRTSFRDIEDGRLPTYSGGASQLDVASAVDVVSKLMHGKWVLLLDNANLVGSDDGEPSEQAVVDFEYELTRYIPYGDSRD